MTSEQRSTLISRVSAGAGVRATARELGVPEGSALWTMMRHRSRQAAEPTLPPGSLQLRRFSWELSA